MDRLLGTAQSGNARDFALFVRGTQAEIWHFCLGVVGPSDVDDATQETYLAVWRALATFRGDSSARTWIYAIARRTALGILHQRRRWSANLGTSIVVAPARDTGAALEIRQLLAGVELERRVAFVLTQLSGLSYAEAAEICECPVGTIRSRVSRARADLMDLMGESDTELAARSLA